MFWIIAALLILLALAFILPPLLRKTSVTQGVDYEKNITREQNIQIAKEQLHDLKNSFEEGEIDKKSYQATRGELEQTLFLDVQNEGTITATNKKTSLLSSMLIALLVPIISIIGYYKYGSRPFTTSLDSMQAAKTELDSKVPRKADGSPDLDKMILGLQEKMDANPKNKKGWTMLGRSYSVMRRYDDAAKSYQHALSLDPKSADLMLALADSLAMANNGEIEGRPVALIQQALAVEPNNQMALWLGGMAARQQGEYLTAIKRWQKVLPMTQDPNEQKEVQSLIDEATARLTPQQKQEITKQAAATASNASAKVSAKGINITISLSEKFKAQVSPTDIIFIYAKAMSGPPMPLAAAKKQVKDLPITITLDDSMAMMPSMKLSNFGEVVVGARISKSGRPISQNGDLFTEKKSVKAGDVVNLEIDSVVSK